MKEALAYALGGICSLAESKNHSTAPVDRLHAVAAAQRRETYPDHRNAALEALLVSLGVDVIRYTRARITKAGPAATLKLKELLLADRKLKMKSEAAMLVALQAMAEVYENSCRVCRGRTDGEGVASIPKAFVADGPVPMCRCPACGGTGIHRYSDWERRELLGDDVAKLSRAMAFAHNLIGRAVGQAEGMAQRLIGT